MVKETIYDRTVGLYQSLLCFWAKEIVSAKDSRNSEREKTCRNRIEGYLNDFRDYANGDKELQYKVKKCELFLIGSED